MFAVIIHEKGGQPRRQEFAKTEVTIGRVQGNDIILPKQNVSKRHSRIVVKDGKFIIVDLKSTNGTYVNGRKIASPMVIKPTDKIYIGDFILSVEAMDGADAEAPEAIAPAMPAPAPAPEPPRPAAPPPPPRPAAPPPPAPAAPPPPAPAAPPPPAPAPVRPAPRPVPAPAPRPAARPAPAPAPRPAPPAPRPAPAPAPAPAPVVAPPPAAPAPAPAPAPVAAPAPAAPAPAAVTPDLGPLKALVDDDTVQRILVNGAHRVQVVRGGKAEPGPSFTDESAVLAAAAGLFAQAGLPFEGPFAEANLPDGTHIHFASAAVGGPYLTIDRPQIGRMDMDALVANGVVSDGIASFLSLAMAAGRGVIVACNDVDARLEFMNALAKKADGLRIIAVDGGGRFGDGAITLTGGAGATPTEVVQQALKMHPDRLFVGDCRGPETFHAIAALAGAVDGGVVGVTAESPDDAMIRILRQAATAVPTHEDKIAGLVREAADVLVQLLRYADGKLVVTQVLDLDGEQTEVFSGFSATGHTPRWVSNAQSLGHTVDLNIFR